MRTRMQPYIRWFGLPVAVVVLLALLAENNRLLNYAKEKALAASGLPLRIERISGGLLSGITLHRVAYRGDANVTVRRIDVSIARGVRLDEARFSGKAAVGVRQVRVEPVLTALLGGELRFRKIAVLGPEADIEALVAWLSEPSEPSQTPAEPLPLKRLAIDRMEFRTGPLRYGEIILEGADLWLRDLSYDLNATVAAELGGNLQLNGVRLADFRGKVTPGGLNAKGFLSLPEDSMQRGMLPDTLVIPAASRITLELQSDFKTARAALRGRGDALLRFDGARLEHLYVGGTMDIAERLVAGNLQIGGGFEGAPVTVEGKMGADLNDLNRTLAYRISAGAEGLERIAASYLEGNLTLAPGTRADLNVTGDIYGVRAALHTRTALHHGASGSIPEGTLQLGTVAGEGRFAFAKQRLEASARVDGAYEGASLEVRLDAAAALTDLNGTLDYRGTVHLGEAERIVTHLLPDANLTLAAGMPVDCDLSGSAKRAHLSCALKGGAVLPDLGALDLSLGGGVDMELVKMQGSGQVTAGVDGEAARGEAAVRFSFDARAPTGDVAYEGGLRLARLALKGLNPDSAAPLQLTLRGDARRLDAAVNAPWWQATLDSGDMDRFRARVTTIRSALDERFTDLPPAIAPMTLELAAEGNYTLSAQEGRVRLQIPYLGNGEAPPLEGVLTAAYKEGVFRLEPSQLQEAGNRYELEGRYGEGNVTARLRAPVATAELSGTTEPLRLQGRCDIASLKALQTFAGRFVALTPLEIDGVVKLEGRFSDGAAPEGVFEASSEAIILKSGRLEAIHIAAEAFGLPEAGGRAVLNRFDLTTAGFPEKAVNRGYTLRTPGSVTWNAEGHTEVDLVFDRAATLRGWIDRSGADLRLRLEQLGVIASGYGSAAVDADIAYVKGPGGAKLEGNMAVKDAKITYRPTELAIDQDPDIVIVTHEADEAVAEENAFTALAMDLNMTNRNPVWYKTQEADIQLDTDIRVVKDPGGPVRLMGRAATLKGVYSLEGKEFLLEKAEIRFRGQDPVDPLLNLRLRHEVDEVKIYIRITGTAGDPKIAFSSSPMMSQGDILAYLMFGVGMDQLKGTDGEQRDYSRKAAAFFAGAVSKDILNSIGIPVDRFEVTDEGSGGFGFDLRKKLTRDFAVGFKRKDGDERTVVEYDLSPGLGVQIENGRKSNSVDLFYRRSFE